MISVLDSVSTPMPHLFTPVLMVILISSIKLIKIKTDLENDLQSFVNWGNKCAGNFKKPKTNLLDFNRFRKLYLSSIIRTDSNL